MTNREKYIEFGKELVENKIDEDFDSNILLDLVDSHLNFAETEAYLGASINLFTSAFKVEADPSQRVHETFYADAQTILKYDKRMYGLDKAFTFFSAALQILTEHYPLPPKEKAFAMINNKVYEEQQQGYEIASGWDIVGYGETPEIAEINGYAYGQLTGYKVNASAHVIENTWPVLTSYGSTPRERENLYD